MSEEQQPQDAGKEAIKIENEYRQCLQMILERSDKKDEKSLSQNKLSIDEAETLIAELFKEERKAAGVAFQVKFKGLIVANAELGRIAEEEQRKLNKIILDKKKEFSKATRDAFKEVERAKNLDKAYLESMKQAVAAGTAPPEQGEQAQPE